MPESYLPDDTVMARNIRAALDLQISREEIRENALKAVPSMTEEQFFLWWSMAQTLIDLRSRPVPTYSAPGPVSGEIECRVPLCEVCGDEGVAELDMPSGNFTYCGCELGRGMFKELMDDLTAEFSGGEFTEGCRVSIFSSRACELGTKGCVVYHGEESE